MDDLIKIIVITMICSDCLMINIFMTVLPKNYLVDESNFLDTIAHKK